MKGRGVKAICVFCGSRFGNDPGYRAMAATVGRAIAERGLTLIYGGGRVGLMGTLADAALAAGGAVTGVIPGALADREVAHGGLGELIVTESMHERKARMAELADGFIALPGGFGTLEELCEILTWAQLGIHQKPIGVLDVACYFDHFIAFIDTAEAAGFIEPVHRGLIQRAVDPVALLDSLARYQPPALPRWVTPAKS